MASTKTTALTSDASPTGDDLVMTVTDPAGTPVNRKATLADIAIMFAGLATFTGAYDAAGSAAAVNSSLSSHLADTVDAHDASAISFVPAAGIAATNTQAAIEEVVADASGTYLPAKVVDAALGNVVADATAALVDALANHQNVFVPAGTYLCDPDVLVQMTRGRLIGAGRNTTIIKLRGAVGGVLFQPGDFDTTVDGITFDGNNIAGTTGILCNEAQRPNQASWGSVGIKNCPVAGMKVHQPNGGSGIYYNDFGRLWVQDSGKGLWLTTDGAAALVNANTFDSVKINNCTDGLVIDSADGNRFGFVVAEICTTGIRMTEGDCNYIFGGWLEGNTANYVIGDNPLVKNFVSFAISDEAFPAGYVISANRSDLIAHDSKYMTMAGRWFFNRLDGLDTNSRVLVGDGSAAEPGLSFIGNPTHGLYASAEGIRFAVNGTEKMRLRSDELRVFQNVRVTGNLGVSNSAAATTPGTVTKKIQIFDNAGTSLGYIAVYDAIT